MLKKPSFTYVFLFWASLFSICADVIMSKGLQRSKIKHYKEQGLIRAELYNFILTL